MTCDECKFWRQERDASAHGKGRCYFHPPAVVAESDCGYSLWPETRAYDFCSKFEAGCAPAFPKPRTYRTGLPADLNDEIKF